MKVTHKKIVKEIIYLKCDIAYNVYFRITQTILQN